MVVDKLVGGRWVMVGGVGLGRVGWGDEFSSTLLGL